MSDHSNKHRISVPSITIPSRSGPADGLSSMGSSNPSPMTVLSNFLADNLTGGGEFRGSFTQLLAMASPSAAAAMAAAGGTATAASSALGGISSSGLMGLGETPSSFWGEMSENNGSGSGQKNGGSGENNKLPGSGSGSVAAFKQNRPAGLMVPVSTSSLFPVSPGFSPSAFLNSPPPGFFSPTLSSFGMSHQQALAQVTAQAAAQSQSQSNTHHPSSSSAPAPLPSFNPLATNHHQQYIFETPTSNTTTLLSSDQNLKLGQTSQHPPPDSHTSQFSDHHYQLPAPVDKPAEDGYNWRKYGQKQVKGSEYPRSYYRCTHLNCPVKKKVERSRDGHITEIIYKGQHNHGKPQIGRRGASKDNNAVAIEGSGSQGQIGVGLQQWSNGGGLLRSGGGGDEDAATSIQLHGPSDSEEESGEAADDAEDHERDGKRRNTGAAGTCEMSMSTHKTVTEPKIIVQTRSRVDLLDDGYRWRKYGQKVVKGNPNPRSYYKCTTVGCTVRKHVERSSKDAEAVITTYEGKHNHDVPVGRNNNNSNNNANAQQRLQNNNNAAASAGAGDVRQSSLNYQEVDFQFREERPVAFLRLKEERYHN